MFVVYSVDHETRKCTIHYLVKTRLQSIKAVAYEAHQRMYMCSKSASDSLYHPLHDGSGVVNADDIVTRYTSELFPHDYTLGYETPSDASFIVLYRIHVTKGKFYGQTVTSNVVCRFGCIEIDLTPNDQSFNLLTVPVVGVVATQPTPTVAVESTTTTTTPDSTLVETKLTASHEVKPEIVGVVDAVFGNTVATPTRSEDMEAKIQAEKEQRQRVALKRGQVVFEMNTLFEGRFRDRQVVTTDKTPRELEDEFDALVAERKRQYKEQLQTKVDADLEAKRLADLEAAQIVEFTNAAAETQEITLTPADSFAAIDQLIDGTSIVPSGGANISLLDTNPPAIIESFISIVAAHQLKLLDDCMSIDLASDEDKALGDYIQQKSIRSGRIAVIGQGEYYNGITNVIELPDPEVTSCSSHDLLVFDKPVTQIVWEWNPVTKDSSTNYECFAGESV